MSTQLLPKVANILTSIDLRESEITAETRT
jgi:hypothetical protein